MPVGKAHLEDAGGAPRPTTWMLQMVRVKEGGTYTDSQFLGQRHLESTLSGRPFWSL